jgi:hypothetical protein
MVRTLAALNNAALESKAAKDNKLYGLASWAYKTWNGETATTAIAIHPTSDDLNNSQHNQKIHGNINRLKSAGKLLLAATELPNHSVQNRDIMK